MTQRQYQNQIPALAQYHLVRRGYGIVLDLVDEQGGARARHAVPQQDYQSVLR